MKLSRKSIRLMVNRFPLRSHSPYKHLITMEKMKNENSVTDWTTLLSKTFRKSYSTRLSACSKMMWLHATLFLQIATLFVSTKSGLFLSSVCIMRMIWIKTLSAVKKHGKLVCLWCHSSTLFQQCFFPQMNSALFSKQSFHCPTCVSDLWVII